MASRGPPGLCARFPAAAAAPGSLLFSSFHFPAAQLALAASVSSAATPCGAVKGCPGASGTDFTLFSGSCFPAPPPRKRGHGLAVDRACQPDFRAREACTRVGV